MFNLLVAASTPAWENPYSMSMPTERFKEYSGTEATEITPKQSSTLKVLETVPALLMYEWAEKKGAADTVRYGFLQNIKVAGKSLVFSFKCEAHCQRSLVDDFAHHLGLTEWERQRTHWAIKDGEIPADMLRRMTRDDPTIGKYRYEVVLTYAGEDQEYVTEVAKFLQENGVKLFFAPFREAELWGKDLSEELDTVYRMDGRFCVMFLSEKYAEKAWPTHERRSAIARAVQQRTRYILPCRFDKTDVPGLPSSVHYVDLATRTPIQLGNLILEVLGRAPA